MSGLSLKGLAEEWDGEQEVRAHFRQHRRLFTSSSGKPEPVCHVKEAALNKKVLVGIARRMGEHYAQHGSLLIFKIGAVEAEILVRMII